MTTFTSPAPGGIRMATRGRDAEAVQALIDRRDSVTSPFYSGD